ncbi:MAG: hypothetical protein ACFCUE_09830 [Candidatus Bathyarchaeia archaeon]|jgi:hypothetical protein
MKSAQKTLLIIIFILLLSSACVFTVPSARAAEPSVQDKTLSVLRDVVGLETEHYTTESSSQRDSLYISLVQKEANLCLLSNQSRLTVRCSFVNNQLQEIYLSDRKGDLSLKQSVANTADYAKGFLERFQNYTQNSIC